MSRYVPSTTEQTAIQTLTLQGFHVERRSTHERRLERIRVLECMAQMETERRESVEAWARRECDEQRRLADRLNRIAAAAASLGVSIQAINAALDGEG